MNINTIKDRQVQVKTPLLATKTMTPFLDQPPPFDAKGHLSRLGIILLAAFVVAPDYSFAKAKHSSADLAAEVARLKQQLGATQQENQQLKSALSNANKTVAADTAVTAEPQPAPGGIGSSRRNRSAR